MAPKQSLLHRSKKVRKSKMFKNITILGAGSWGMALARVVQSNNANVTMWEFDKDDCEIIRTQRCHPKKLAKIKLDDSIMISNDLLESVKNAELVVLAVPSQSLRKVLQNLKAIDFSNTSFVNVAKGIEIGSLKRMSEVLHEELEIPFEKIATLSGPSHAEEVALDIPTAVVTASESFELRHEVQQIFSTNSLRVYHSDDLIGIELGGSLKNIIAIAAGISAGLQMGDNTMGALLTRGLAEITRLGQAMGAKPDTFAGLSGVGDLITTCMSVHSRNRYVGEHIGQGEKLDDIIASMTMVAEGVQTTKSGYELAKKHNVEMPITTGVFNVLFDNKAPAKGIRDLMKRDLKTEIWQ